MFRNFAIISFISALISQYAWQYYLLPSNCNNFAFSISKTIDEINSIENFKFPASLPSQPTLLQLIFSNTTQLTTKSEILALISNHTAKPILPTQNCIILPLLSSLHVEKLSNITKLFTTLHRNIRQKHARLIHNKTVVIIGGGPIGLLTAIEAYTQGTKSLHVIEKRREYTRDVWFDLYNKPFYNSIETLAELGFFTSSIPETVIHNHTKELTITLKTNNIEAFMCKVLHMLNVNLVYETEFYGFSKNKTVALLRNSQTKKHYLDMNFDVLIAADGTQSRVREDTGLQFVRREDVTVTSLEKTLTVSDVHQMSLIINYKPEPSGDCPVEARYYKNNELHPLFAGFLVKGVSSVYRRFYYSQCHIQVLLDRDRELNVSEIDSDLWETLRRVSNIVLAQQYDSVRDFKQAIVKRTNEEFDITVVALKVYSSERFTETHCFNGRCGIVAIVGDAAFTAHYRLGIGINMGFTSLVSTRHILQHLRHAETQFDAAGLEEVVASRERAYSTLVADIVQLQTSTIFYETYCGFAVFFDDEQEDIFHAQVLYKRGENFGFDPIAKEDVEQCVKAFDT